MTISRVKPATWGLGEKLTSAQQNAIDVNVTYALDKRAGQADTLGSVVTLSGAGRFRQRLADGANANTTYLVSAVGTIRLTSAIATARDYTLSNTDAAAGDVITIYSEASLGTVRVTVKDNGGTTLIILGNGGATEARWATFLHNGTGWVVFQAGDRGAPDQYILSTSGAFVNDTYVVPVGVYYLSAQVVGGGGGGGAGTGPAAALVYGGAGGGASLAHHAILSVTPGESLTVTAGGGGTGGAGATVPGTPSNGSNGNLSAVYRTIVLGAPGLIEAAGGRGGSGAKYSGGSPYHALGGLPGGMTGVNLQTTSAPASWQDLPRQGQGGWGTTSALASDYGTGGSYGHAGGLAGSTTANGTGGGGGACSNFSESAGGSGGSGWSGAGATPDGVAGTLGGGGGGGGGNGAATSGAGGKGGAGMVVLTPLY